MLCPISVHFHPSCRTSLSCMSQVEFKKCSCRPANFRGQGPSSEVDLKAAGAAPASAATCSISWVLERRALFTLISALHTEYSLSLSSPLLPQHGETRRGPELGQPQVTGAIITGSSADKLLFLSKTRKAEETRALGLKD